MQLSSKYSCPKRYYYQRTQPEASPRSSGKAALGTATHAVLARALTTRPTSLDLEQQLRAALELEPAIDWYDDDPDKLIRERAAMIRGVLAELDQWVLRVIACESAFIAPFDRYWLSGHIDLIYEPKATPGTIALADWKTSAEKPAQVELDHGWEGAVYSAGLRDGIFISEGISREATERELIERALSGPITPTYGVFPSHIYQVHLGDYVPYVRKGSRWVSRIEDLRRWGYDSPRDHAYVAGDTRGGAWMPIALHEGDLRRLSARLRSTVGPVRMGAFPDRITEGCVRCPHRNPCLTSGYQSTDTAELALLKQLATLGDTTP
jgi:hypothetical protein